MDNDFYYVKYLQLDSELEIARARIRNLEKEIQELKTKAVETFAECRSLNEENAKLKNQLKSREILE